MRPLRLQLIRYATVGLLSNIFLYCTYILLIWLSVGPKIAMTLVYTVGVMQTFILNKRWSFRHRGLYGPSFVRYCVVYGFGYVMNFLAFLFLVDRLKYSHELVQAIMVVVVAVTLFLAQRYWVFPQAPAAHAS